MTNSTRFAVAIHILATIAECRPAPVTSDRIAASVNTNPAVVRRILSQLGSAGLTTAQMGKGGGAQLARRPKKITLLDIYLAVEEPGLISLHRSLPDQNCPIGRNIQAAIHTSTKEAEKAFLTTLGATTLKKLLKELHANQSP